MAFLALPGRVSPTLSGVRPPAGPTVSCARGDVGRPAGPVKPVLLSGNAESKLHASRSMSEVEARRDAASPPGGQPVLASSRRSVGGDARSRRATYSRGVLTGSARGLPKAIRVACPPYPVGPAMGARPMPRPSGGAPRWFSLASGLPGPRPGPRLLPQRGLSCSAGEGASVSGP